MGRLLALFRTENSEHGSALLHVRLFYAFLKKPDSIPQ